VVHAVIPTGELTTRKILGTTTIVYVAPGAFSSNLNDETDAVFMRLIKPIAGTEDGCNPVVPALRNRPDFYLLVARGNCSFIDKATAAKNAGALGVVVYNSLQGIYQGRTYASPMDYECANGAGYVRKVVEPVYDDAMNALMPTTCTQHPSCASKRCLLTNVTDAVLGTKVCCAWDLYTTMGSSHATDDDENMPNIPAVFIRMRDADTLMRFDELNSQTLEVAMFARPTSMFDFASILIWLIAVVTVASGATLAAEEDKLQQQGLKGLKSGYRERGYDGGDSSDVGSVSSEQYRAAHAFHGGPGTPITPTAANAGAGGMRQGMAPSGMDPESNGGSGSSAAAFPRGVHASVVESNPPTLSTYSLDSRSSAVRGSDVSSSPAGRRKACGGGGGGGATPLSKTSHSNDRANNDIDPDSLQITPYHAVGFVVLSSCFLLLMYFIDVYAFVSVLYLAAAAFAASKVFFYPFFFRVRTTCRAIQLGVEIDDVPEYDTLSDSNAFVDVPLVVSALLSAGLAVAWFLHSEEIQWIWVVQDFLGVSVCIMFLSTVHLPNLQTATMLLGLAFCYDVFFVFISPYVFGSSVMVKVATGPTVALHADENFCEKYPTNRDCDTNTLPMMLIVPTFSSYLSTESMLGLGDIVLPGLLLAWAARLDIRSYGSLSSPYASKGYFPMVTFGYAIGLMAANFAVEYFETGQPALLYIVPLTLGPVLLRSFRSGTLPELWRGLPRMKTIAQPFDTAEQEALLSGRASVFPAEATWTEKAAEVGMDYVSVPRRAVMSESVTLEQFNSAMVSARPLPVSSSSAVSSQRSRNSNVL